MRPISVGLLVVCLAALAGCSDSDDEATQPLDGLSGEEASELCLDYFAVTEAIATSQMTLDEAGMRSHVATLEDIGDRAAVHGDDAFADLVRTHADVLGSLLEGTESDPQTAVADMQVATLRVQQAQATLQLACLDRDLAPDGWPLGTGDDGHSTDTTVAG